MNMIFFTGFSASGKSTLAELINLQLSYRLIKEREIIHNLAVERGYSRSRFWLLAEGVEPMVEAARSKTIQLLHESSKLKDKGALIDGAYDREIVQITKKLFWNDQILVINIATEEEIRIKRMMLRLGSDREKAEYELHGIDRFKKSSGVEEINARADIHINNSGKIEDSLAILSKELQNRMYI